MNKRNIVIGAGIVALSQGRVTVADISWL